MTDFTEETLLEFYSEGHANKTLNEFIIYLEDNNHTLLGEDITSGDRNMKKTIRGVVKRYSKKDLTKKTEQEKWEDETQKEILSAVRRMIAPSFRVISLTIGDKQISSGKILFSEILQEDNIRVRVISRSKYEEEIDEIESTIKLQTNKAKRNELRENIPMLNIFRNNLEKIKKKADVKERTTVSIRKPLSVDSLITKSDIMKIFSIEATIQESDTREAIYKFWEEVRNSETGSFENAIKTMITKIEENEQTYANEIKEYISEIKEYVLDLQSEKPKGYTSKVKGLKSSIVDYEQLSEDFVENLENMKSALLRLNEILFSDKSRRGYLYTIPKDTKDRKLQPLETVIRYIEGIVETMDDRLDGGSDYNYEEQEGEKVTQRDIQGEEFENVKGGTKKVREASDAEDVLVEDKTEIRQYLDAIDKEIKDFDQEVVEQGLDPLLAYDVEKNNTLVTLTKRMRDIIIRELEKRRNVVLFQPEALKFLDDKIEELGKTLTVKRKEYYLPIFYIRDRDFYDSLDVKVAKDIERIDNEFSKAMEDFQDSLVKAFKFKPKKVRDRRIVTGGRGIGNTLNPEARDRGSKEFRRLQTAAGRKTGKQNIESEVLRGDSFKKFRKDLKDFATAYEEYMIDPFRSSRNVIVAPRHIQNITTAILEFVQKEGSDEDIDLFNSNPMTMTSRTKLGMEDLMTPKEIYAIQNLLEYVVKGFSSGVEDEGKFKYRMQNAREMSSNLDLALRAFKQKVTPELSTSEIANQLSTVIMTNIKNDKVAEAVGSIDFKGEKIAMRKNKSSSSRNIIASLRVHIAELRPEYESQGGLSSPIDNLYDLLTEISTDMGMPLVYKLLKGYDSVRGMLGKEVVYNHIPLSYNGIDYFLDNNSYDLSHLEVENIVKSLDSHENLSKKYGVKSDDVYLIKANFR